MPIGANLFYGSYWRIGDTQDAREAATATLSTALEADDGAEFYDMLDDMAEKFNAHIAFQGETVTVYFGHRLFHMSSDENDFDEMSLLRVMDLKTGVLEQSVKDSVKKTLEEVPYSLRGNLSSPGFYTAWEGS